MGLLLVKIGGTALLLLLLCGVALAMSRVVQAAHEQPGGVPPNERWPLLGFTAAALAVAVTAIGAIHAMWETL